MRSIEPGISRIPDAQLRIRGLLLAHHPGMTEASNLRHPPCRADLGEDRIEAIDHASDFVPRDIERRHETQRVRLRRIEQHAIVKRLGDDRSGDGVFQVEREQQTSTADLAQAMSRGKDFFAKRQFRDAAREFRSALDEIPADPLATAMVMQTERAMKKGPKRDRLRPSPTRSPSPVLAIYFASVSIAFFAETPPSRRLSPN